MRKRLLEGLKINETNPINVIDAIVTNLSKILNKLESELRETDRVSSNQAKLLKKLNQRQADLEKDYAQIRLDLKSAMILHDEPYTPPPVDSISEKPQRKSESKNLKRLQKDDPLG